MRDPVSRRAPLPRPQPLHPKPRARSALPPPRRAYRNIRHPHPLPTHPPRLAPRTGKQGIIVSSRHAPDTRRSNACGNRVIQSGWQVTASDRNRLDRRRASGSELGLLGRPTRPLECHALHVASRAAASLRYAALLARPSPSLDCSFGGGQGRVRKRRTGVSVASEMVTGRLAGVVGWDSLGPEYTWITRVVAAPNVADIRRIKSTTTNFRPSRVRSSRRPLT